MGKEIKKNPVFFSIFFIFIDLFGAAAVRADLNFGKLPLYFITNKGQVDAKAKFYARSSRYTLWLTEEGFVFDGVIKLDTGHSIQDEESSIHHPSLTTNHFTLTRYDRDVSRLLFIGANKNPEMVPFDEAKLKVNYFIGSDRSKWHCDVPTSKAVLYKNLYKNIDLKVYGSENQIEYDWIVKIGGDPGDIRFAYKNVKRTRLDAGGDLIIETDFGELIHKRPISYQVIKAQRDNGTKAQRKMVEVKFETLGKNIYGISVGDYDKSYGLIIDPIILAYSTYLGGDSWDTGRGIAVDESGVVYVTGSTSSTDFPTCAAYQTNLHGYNDVFVIKLDINQSGDQSILYSTYLGGDMEDYGSSIELEESGVVYVAGYTWSSNFPTHHAYQANCRGRSDAFILKLDTNINDDSGLLYSSYLGGKNRDECYGMAMAGNGLVYLAGFSKSTNFPIRNQYQANRLGEQDAFVAMFDTTVNGDGSLLYSTYLGGNRWEAIRAIAVDQSGMVYVTGYTISSDFPTRNAYQTNLHGEYDVFLTRLDINQSGDQSILYSTLLGGESFDESMGIALDDHGVVYVAGYTYSKDFPTRHAYQAGCQEDDYNALVAKLDTNVSGDASLLYSTYLGGSGEDFALGIALDKNGMVYVTGYTQSSDFPIRRAYQELQGYSDAFITKLDTTVSGNPGLLYSTYLGGGYDDSGCTIAVDDNCVVYVTGYTRSSDFPTRNAYQASLRGGYDAFVAKLRTPSISGTVLDSLTGTGISEVTLYFSNDSGSTQTDQRGRYHHPVPFNWSGTVTPARIGYVFEPASRSYQSVDSDIDGQDYMAYYIVLSLQAVRKIEKAWLIGRQYGKLELIVENPGDIPIAKYVIYRKEPGVNFQVLNEIPGSQLQDGIYLYYDKYLDKDKLYTYKFTALGSTGVTIAASDEKTI